MRMCRYGLLAGMSAGAGAGAGAGADVMVAGLGDAGVGGRGGDGAVMRGGWVKAC